MESIAVFEVQRAIEQVLERADDMPGFVLFAVMFAGSFLEYVFPPVPGDLCTVAGAILIARGQKFLTVFLGVNLGSAVGFLIDYFFGVWLANPARRFRHWGPRWERLGRGIDRIAVGFERHTALYLVVNRFLPGVRALFFVAAGFARVPVGKVLAFGLAGSVIWSLLLIGAGFAVGLNLEALLRWVGIYNWAAGGILIAVVAVMAVRHLRKSRK